ncbi:hypothetical protein HanPI659440_Chr04g0166671 [Helianthus annuus]|nr:hypothetical protein HanXRQr2_Chr04g0172291 [Helianthus annuus]KAJ0597406.1 hypothetical protein HanHA89_Chr04g0154241 [Helianthus annuus]KAJ0761735.1 hypothetical protein HanOQP8_Chr04g0153351 [Helianthus annuus]KAJ0796809.1 hypothetical protein HanPI659440_Chr04g0166671 [Helianthus annuus]KAJ0931784.1 hypothetical protein HanPSC8_Chr04g0165941 [Helianthus annuus]
MKIAEWQFNKRLHLRGLPPRNLPLPPPGVPESVVRIVLVYVLTGDGAGITYSILHIIYLRLYILLTLEFHTRR